MAATAATAERGRRILALILMTLRMLMAAPDAKSLAVEGLPDRVIFDCRSSSPQTRYSAPNDCHSFYQCLDPDSHIPVKMSCGFLHFNPVLGSCDWPANVIRIRPECGKTFKTFSEGVFFDRPATTTPSPKEPRLFIVNAVSERNYTLKRRPTVLEVVLKPDVFLNKTYVYEDITTNDILRRNDLDLEDFEDVITDEDLANYDAEFAEEVAGTAMVVADSDDYPEEEEPLLTAGSDSPVVFPQENTDDATMPFTSEGDGQTRGNSSRKLDMSNDKSNENSPINLDDISIDVLETFVRENVDKFRKEIVDTVVQAPSKCPCPCDDAAGESDRAYELSNIDNLTPEGKTKPLMKEQQESISIVNSTESKTSTPLVTTESTTQKVQSTDVGTTVTEPATEKVLTTEKATTQNVQATEDRKTVKGTSLKEPATEKAPSIETTPTTEQEGPETETASTNEKGSKAGKIGTAFPSLLTSILFPSTEEVTTLMAATEATTTTTTSAPTTQTSSEAVATLQSETSGTIWNKWRIPSTSTKPTADQIPSTTVLPRVTSEGIQSEEESDNLSDDLTTQPPTTERPYFATSTQSIRLDESTYFPIKNDRKIDDDVIDDVNEGVTYYPLGPDEMQATEPSVLDQFEPRSFGGVSQFNLADASSLIDAEYVIDDVISDVIDDVIGDDDEESNDKIADCISGFLACLDQGNDAGFESSSAEVDCYDAFQSCSGSVILIPDLYNQKDSSSEPTAENPVIDLPTLLSGGKANQQATKTTVRSTSSEIIDFGP